MEPRVRTDASLRCTGSPRSMTPERSRWRPCAASISRSDAASSWRWSAPRAPESPPCSTSSDVSTHRPTVTTVSAAKRWPASIATVWRTSATGGSVSSSRTSISCPSSAPSKTSRCRSCLAALVDGSGAAARSSSWMQWASQTGWSTSQPSSPAGRCRGWPSPVPWRWNRISCSPTSPRATSTPAPGPTFSACSTIFRSRAGP